MPEYIQRMMKEKEDLAIKVRKAEDFLSNPESPHLNKFQTYLLENQVVAMKRYLDILTTRIESERFIHAGDSNVNNDTAVGQDSGTSNV